nr:MAG TPA: hypothetical protein [Caudoviricetes sp.]
MRCICSATSACVMFAFTLAAARLICSLSN